MHEDAESVKPASSTAGSYRIGVDVGGTFTDFYAICDKSGDVHTHKTASTPSNPADGIIDGLQALCRKSAIPLHHVTRISHGTTVGTNALIQRNGCSVALVTTRGFRDLLEIGRQTRPHMYDLQKDHPDPLVRRTHRIELDERLDALGDIVRAPTESDIGAAIEAVKATGADACAIGFLFAFRNPEHERRFAEKLRQCAPGLAISLSSEVQPEFREYERFSTTVLNAYLQPVMGNYLRKLEHSIAELTPNASLGINQSSGGLMSVSRARDLPVRTALSGPAAGVVGAAHTARETGRRQVITLDMGGTSADVALIRDYGVDLANDRMVAGFPIRMPTVDVETVGAGGGSVAWFDRDGLLKAGPVSAGADPGPACYGKGGDQPTTTDANLILGRLSERGLLNGDMRLDPQPARAAYEPLARRLGFSIEKTAHGVVGIVVANMVRAIRRISVERGHDPRSFTLMPFGGAGPLHARDVAVNFGMIEMVVPAAPGIVCAQGLLVSDLKEIFVSSQRLEVSDSGVRHLTRILQELQQRADAWFENEQAGPGDRRVELSVDARYVGQNFELALPLAGGGTRTLVDIPDAETIGAAFSRAHEAAYGYASAADPVEIINTRLSASVRLHPTECKPLVSTDAGEPVPRDHRAVIFDDPDTPMMTPVFDRARMQPGLSITGPAVIEQMDTTIPVFPGDIARLTPEGHLIIRIGRRDTE
ncbi:MAG: hydantoinase/oxoprolinase family protein [Rhodobacteraceae bacterium]|nr:hydantoinase/oxoprolinase family protein [Paracoccaceae bacterium]